VEALLVRSVPPRVDASIAALVEIARDLRDLPRESFKARLKSNLERTSVMASQATSASATRQTATSHLRIRNVPAAIEFYKKAFGASEVMRFELQGQIPYAEIAIGNSVISLGEEALEHGYPSPQTLGGSPMSIHLAVEDVDAFVEHAVAAGAKLTGAVSDQFYGDRSGSVTDPFGYTWGIATRKVEMSVDEMHQRFNEMMKAQEPSGTATSYIPKGYHTVTPYLVAQEAPALIDFVTNVFGGEETFRAIGSAGGIHAEVRVGDSMLMIGGGAPDLSWRGQTWPTALHVYVKDTDAAYERALKAGAESIQPPADQEYGERSGSVKDRAGNHWYIATAKGGNYIPEGLRTVNPYLHPLRGEPVINFLKRGFGAGELQKYASPDGVIHHAKIKIGDSVLELGEAHGPYQPMPTMFYLYVPNVDASYSRALNAGATSTGEPADQPYGDRTASVKDAFGNQWYIATHIRG
jgi:PhnB protein